MRRYGILLVGVVIVGAVGVGSGGGCAPKTPVLSAQGFRHQDYDLTLVPLQGTDLMPPTWQLENFYLKTLPATSPTAAPTVEWTPKRGPKYEATYVIDSDGDGMYDIERGAPRYVLKFVHTQSQGVISLRLIPISPALESHTVQSLLQRFIEALSGTATDSVWLAKDEAVVSHTKTLATTVVSETTTTLGGNDAYSSLIEVADVDQLKLDPTHRLRRLRVVLARTPFRWLERTPSPSTGTAPAASACASCGAAAAKPSGYALLLLAVHGNAPAAFDQTDPDFLALLQRLTIAGQQGTPLSTAAAAPAAATTESSAALPAADAAAAASASAAPSAASASAPLP